RVVTFGGAWDEHAVGQACMTSRSDIVCPVSIGLGDRTCEDAWKPFTQATLVRIATHEVGHAIGLEHVDDPGDVMYETLEPRHIGFCPLFQGDQDIRANHWWGMRFEVPTPRAVRYEIQAHDGDRLDVCIMSPANWEALATHEPTGWGCRQGWTQPGATAELTAGEYVLAAKCSDVAAPCSLSYELGWA
ncbi:MAG: matrixin family metalloprotease, partial [Candidatus Thermoplasmatota archaeon]|nr:matrixin family metalloprotease [Candidatus Thermoplasmatota archaeon]